MEQYNFELLAARFVSLVVKDIPEKLVSVVFSSPLSARSPDLCMLWHPGYLQKHKIKLFVKSLLALPLEFSKCLLRRLWKKDYFSYALYGNIDKALLIFPSNCGYLTREGEHDTAYVKRTGNEGVFVFGDVSTCGKGEIKVKGASAKEKLFLSLSLIGAGGRAFFNLKEKPLCSFLLLSYWLVWVFSLNWLRVLYLENALTQVIKKYALLKIGCIHEMHYYSRTIWRLAQKNNISSYTVQHAAISSGKRWYFSYPEEIESGLVLPSVMYVYDRNVEKLLKPYFKDTIFKLGCSSRYAHWRTFVRVDSVGLYYLFAGALADFDNDILLGCLKKIVDAAKDALPIMVRLHSAAIVRSADKKWLDKSCAEGKIKFSDRTLGEDLKNSLAVVGMSTTVLEEALLLGRPAIQITHPDYLEYVNIRGIKGAKTIDYRDFTARDLLNAAAVGVDSEIAKQRLGLEEEEVTYTRLFA